jgi:hypothetical protein
MSWFQPFAFKLNLYRYIKDLLAGVDGDPNKVEERIRERFEKRKVGRYKLNDP